MEDHQSIMDVVVDPFMESVEIIVGDMSWGPDPWARRLAGSPHLTSPSLGLSLRELTGGNSRGQAGWPGRLNSTIGVN